MRNAELANLRMQWEAKLSELQAKNAQAVNQAKEESLTVRVITWSRV